MYIRWMTPGAVCEDEMSSAQLSISYSFGGSLAAGFGSSVWIEWKSHDFCLMSDGLGFPVGAVA